MRAGGGTTGWVVRATDNSSAPGSSDHVVLHTCKWVYPGMRMSFSSSARSTITRIRSLRPFSTAPTSPRSHRRISVATWSFRERPVWSLPPSGPMSSVNRRSFAV